MTWTEYEAMDIFKISTEDDWYALPHDERERKVGYVMSKAIIHAITQYESAHGGNKPPKKHK